MEQVNNDFKTYLQQTINDERLDRFIPEILDSFTKLILPKNTYLGMDKDINTLGVTAMIITNRNTNGVRVQKFLELLFGSDEILSRESLQANYISKKTALKGISIPFHQEAQIYFNKVGNKT